MAAKSAAARLITVVLAVVLVAAACRSTAEARGVPEALPETLHEGTVLIPGIGRYELGTHHMPDIAGLDHSVPAAANGQFIPGADDTWVPNPGFEVPNPFHPAGSSSSP